MEWRKRSRMLRRHLQLVELQQAGVLRQQTHDDRLAVLGRHRRDTNVDRGVAQLDGEATVLWQALLGNIQAGHQLEAQDQRRGNLRIGFGLHMQHAVDAKTDHQRLFLRFDVNVRSAHLQRFFEHRVEQLDHRRIFGTGGQAENVAELGRDVAHVGREFLGQTADFRRTAVYTVNGRHQLALGHHGKVDLALDHARHVRQRR